jgi:hypothetical protein
VEYLSTGGFSEVVSRILFSCAEDLLPLRPPPLSQALRYLAVEFHPLVLRPHRKAIVGREYLSGDHTAFQQIGWFAEMLASWCKGSSLSSFYACRGHPGPHHTVRCNILIVKIFSSKISNHENIPTMERTLSISCRRFNRKWSCPLSCSKRC